MHTRKFIITLVTGVLPYVDVDVFFVVVVIVVVMLFLLFYVMILRLFWFLVLHSQFFVFVFFFFFFFFFFLDASTHLYKRLCPSVRRSVRRSVRGDRVEIGSNSRKSPKTLSHCIIPHD